MIYRLSYRQISKLAVCLMILPLFTAAGFQTPIETAQDPSTYPADVITGWINLQLKIIKTTPAPPPFTVRRCAYTGIALYESVVPGSKNYKSVAPALNGLPALPSTIANSSYYWPASANSALAAITRYLYPMTSPANKKAIDSLEAVNLALYSKSRPEDELKRSSEFGKSIATAVFEWSRTDGFDNKTAFTLPDGDGIWTPTPTALNAAALPNWGKNRQIVMGSDSGSDLAIPVPFSTDPASAYYAQVREVYDISQSLTAEQKAIALFWADDPDGKSFGGGHWISIMNQVLLKEKSNLETAALAYAQVGIACSETAISIFKGKYKYNGLRPITYIRKFMNHPEWNALIETPPHPEYPSGHAINSAAAAQILTMLFGENYKFTDNSYNSLGFSPRSYNSFEEAAIEAGNSRVYGGIHYRKTCDAGQLQGKIIAKNVTQKLKFKR